MSRTEVDARIAAARAKQAAAGAPTPPMSVSASRAPNSSYFAQPQSSGTPGRYGYGSMRPGPAMSKPNTGNNTPIHRTNTVTCRPSPTVSTTSSRGSTTNDTGKQTLAFYPAAKENPVCLREEVRCTRDRVPGQAYCMQHCPPDPNYRRCNYISSKTSNRCPVTLVRNECGKEGFCPAHQRLVTQTRRKAARRTRYRDSAETIVQSLKHYNAFSTDQTKMPKPSDNPRNTKAPKIAIDFYSDSSSEDEDSSLVDVPVMSTEIEGELDETCEPLRHAGTFTAEEISVMARDKLIRLQSLYQDYFKIIAYKYKIRRNFYKQRIKEETAVFGPVTDGWGGSYKEKKRLKQYKALRHYRKKSGAERLCRLEQRRRRRGLNEKVLPKCHFKDDSSDTKCDEVALPQNEFCLKHVISDANQLLFGACISPDCRRTVVLVQKNDNYCWIHKPIPTVFSFREPKEPEEAVKISDEEPLEPVDVENLEENQKAPKPETEEKTNTTEKEIVVQKDIVE